MKRVFSIITVTVCSALTLGAFAQVDSTYCQENQTVYLLRYKNESKTKEFTPETINAWRNLFLNCPTQSKNTYIHGVNIYSTLYKKEKDEAKKKQYLDTVMLIYDNRIKYFGEEENYIGRKGADLYMLDPTQYEKAYEFCRQSIDRMGNNAEAKTMVMCLQAAVKKYQNKTMEKTDVIALYQKITDVCNYNISNGTKNGQACEKQMPAIEQLFLSIKPDCSDLIALFEPQFKADPTNPELLTKITDNLSKDCASSDLYMKASVELDKIQPSAQSKRKLGDMYAEKKQISTAMDYYKEAIALETEDSRKAAIYYKMATITSGATSVSYANKALSFNSSLGSAYLVIASKYAESAASCASGAEFPDLEKWKVYWVAYDMCMKAKAVDPSIASQANSYAANYKSHFPDVEALFGYNVTEGTTQTVGCWINQTTTAKVK